MKQYDVAVIGAGPAGVMAAWKAARNGASTILLEKEFAPGRKVCAEGILGNVFDDAEISPSREFAVNKIDGAILYGPDEEKKVNVMGDGYILDKPVLLRTLAERCERSGVEIAYGTTVETIERKNSHIQLSTASKGDKRTVDCKILIGCDGTASVVARKFFNRDNYQVIAAFQYDMVNCNIEDAAKLEIFVGQKKAPAGYIWIFPKNKSDANVGIGLRGSGAKRLLDDFIQNHSSIFQNASVTKALAAPVPVGGELEEYVTDNVMLCGDAAGQVIPLTGAGIHTSLVSGRMAGEVAGNAIRDGDTSSKRLYEYRDRFEDLWGNRIRTSLKALESFERFSDEELNLITQFLEGEDLVEMANGINPSKAIRTLVRHPLLGVKIAYQLLTS